MTLELTWFMLVAFMFVVYVILDGFDIGAGAVYPLLARSNRERDAIFDSIGPVWDGNEVWLLAGGGALLLAFPIVLAKSFSGFYMPLMILLWLLMFRALSIELRHHFHDEKFWKPFWGGAFALSSIAIGIIFGAAMGNVIRGVPMNAEHVFYEPLFTNFRVGENPGILDWYTILIGLTAASALALHGALWVLLKTTGALATRARELAKTLWWAVLALSCAATICTFYVQPQVLKNIATMPWGLIFSLLALAGLGTMRGCLAREDAEKGAFFSSVLFIVAMMGNFAFGIFPNLLPARVPENSLTIWNAASSPYAMTVALYWFLPGLLLAIGYFVFVYGRMPRKFETE